MALAGAENTILYQEEWENQLQARLTEQTKWKDICKVEYTNTRVLHYDYLTDPTVSTGTRGCEYTFNKVIQNNETITINNYFTAPSFIDRADLAQSKFTSLMDLAARQGVLINEKIENYLFSQIPTLTLFDGDEIGGSAGSITVSVTNIDNIITGVWREIQEASGDALFNQYGGFFVWRPSDFEKLVQFRMANGFTEADKALKDGGKQGMEYAGFTHYSSNQLGTAPGRVVAGVKKLWHLGILKGTYGKVVINDKDPGQVSGVSVVSRVDVEAKAWNNTKAV